MPDTGNQTASLGCGTLILIALIVSMFGNSDSDKIKRDIGELSRDVQALTQDVSELSRDVQALTQETQKLRNAVEGIVEKP